MAQDQGPACVPSIWEVLGAGASQLLNDGLLIRKVQSLPVGSSALSLEAHAAGVAWLVAEELRARLAQALASEAVLNACEGARLAFVPKFKRAVEENEVSTCQLVLSGLAPPHHEAPAGTLSNLLPRRASITNLPGGPAFASFKQHAGSDRNTSGAEALGLSAASPPAAWTIGTIAVMCSWRPSSALDLVHATSPQQQREHAHAHAAIPSPFGTRFSDSGVEHRHGHRAAVGGPHNADAACDLLVGHVSTLVHIVGVHHPTDSQTGMTVKIELSHGALKKFVAAVEAAQPEEQHQPHQLFLVPLCECEDLIQRLHSLKALEQHSKALALVMDSSYDDSIALQSSLLQELLTGHVAPVIAPPAPSAAQRVPLQGSSPQPAQPRGPAAASSGAYGDLQREYSLNAMPGLQPTAASYEVRPSPLPGPYAELEQAVWTHYSKHPMDKSPCQSAANSSHCPSDTESSLRSHESSTGGALVGGDNGANGSTAAATTTSAQRAAAAAAAAVLARRTSSRRGAAAAGVLSSPSSGLSIASGDGSPLGSSARTSQPATPRKSDCGSQAQSSLPHSQYIPNPSNSHSFAPSYGPSFSSSTGVGAASERMSGPGLAEHSMAEDVAAAAHARASLVAKSPSQRVKLRNSFMLRRSPSATAMYAAMPRIPSAPSLSPAPSLLPPGGISAAAATSASPAVTSRSNPTTVSGAMMTAGSRGGGSSGGGGAAADADDTSYSAADFHQQALEYCAAGALDSNTQAGMVDAAIAALAPVPMRVHLLQGAPGTGKTNAATRLLSMLGCSGVRTVGAAGSVSSACELADAFVRLMQHPSKQFGALCVSSDSSVLRMGDIVLLGVPRSSLAPHVMYSAMQVDLHMRMQRLSELLAPGSGWADTITEITELTERHNTFLCNMLGLHPSYSPSQAMRVPMAQTFVDTLWEVLDRMLVHCATLRNDTPSSLMNAAMYAHVVSLEDRVIAASRHLPDPLWNAAAAGLDGGDGGGGDRGSGGSARGSVSRNSTLRYRERGPLERRSPGSEAAANEAALRLLATFATSPMCSLMRSAAVAARHVSSLMPPDLTALAASGGPASGSAWLRRVLLQHARVVLCAVNSLHDASTLLLLRESGVWDTLVIDDACAVREADALALLGSCSNVSQLVLFGDLYQGPQPPACMTQLAASCGYNNTLFSRLANTGHPITILNMQYRMAPAISQWPFQQLYSRACMRNAYNTISPSFGRGVVPLLEPFGQFAFIDVCSKMLGRSSPRVMSYRSHEFLPRQADAVARLVEMILRRKAQADAPGSGGRTSASSIAANPAAALSIGIIVPSAMHDQISRIQQALPKAVRAKEFGGSGSGSNGISTSAGGVSVEVGPLPAFAGRAKDIVIVVAPQGEEALRAMDTSLAAAAASGGSVSEASWQAHVAVMRGRYAAWVVGDSRPSLRTPVQWNLLLEECKRRKAVYI